MNDAEFTATRMKLNAAAAELLNLRGPSYASGGDRLSNFKVAGRMVGITPPQACMVYLLKSIISLCTVVQGGPSGGEAVLGRLADARNYIDLLHALFAEEDWETPDLGDPGEDPSRTDYQQDESLP